jgi:hypothetical protein
MTIRFNIFGEAYDDTVPAFFYVDTVADDFYWDRVNSRLISRADLEKTALDKNYSWGPNERGPVPANYKADSLHDIFAQVGTPVVPPVPKPSSGSTGSSTGLYLDDLLDVETPSPVPKDGMVLAYHGPSALWRYTDIDGGIY